MWTRTETLFRVLVSNQVRRIASLQIRNSEVSMGPVDRTQTRAMVPLADSWIAIAGLLAAGAFATFLCPIPTHYSSWTALLGAAIRNVLLVSLAGVMAVSVLSAISSGKSTFDSDRLIIEISFATLWIAPLILFTRENSFWTIAIAVPLAVATTQLLLPAREPPETDGFGPLLFSSDPGNLPLCGFHSRPYISAFAALCVQTGALAALGGQTSVGTLFVGTGVCIWTRSHSRYSSFSDRSSVVLPQFFSRLAAITLAICFMAIGLMPYLRMTGGLSGSARFGGGTPWHPSSQRGHAQLVGSHTSGDVATGMSEGNAGVVLWPIKQTYTKLVAPLPTRGSETFSGHHSNPLVIPFNGVYWYFKAPDRQPPRNSRQVHASPETVNIRSTDLRPLSIEAHEHLGTLINLNCCSKIQIAIRNADRYPDTVSLELVLINTSLPDQPSQSLGRAVVKSTRPWKIYEEPPPASETLNFTIPPGRTLRKFDEFKIVFRMDRARDNAGAKIAIDHFVLIPRTL